MRNVSGVEGAAYVWHDIISAALANVPDKAFAQPSTIQQAWISPWNGGPANWKGSPNILENFKAGTVPTTNSDLSYLKQF